MITFARLACLGASFSSGQEALSHVESTFVLVYAGMFFIFVTMALMCGRRTQREH